MHHDPARPAAVPVLPEIDALPGPERKPPAGHGNDKMRRGQGLLDMPLHVIRTFVAMGVKRIVFRRQAIQPLLKIAPDRRIGVLLDQQARRGVLHEQRAQSFLHAGFAHQRLQALGEFMQALAGCGDS